MTTMQANRVAVGLRLGVNCVSHQWPCDAVLDSRGTDGLASKLTPAWQNSETWFHKSPYWQSFVVSRYPLDKRTCRPSLVGLYARLFHAKIGIPVPGM